jgi:outer membrane protein assembly factor BamD (BamD/ComL family)
MKILFLLLLILTFSPGSLWAGEDDRIYSAAQRMAKEGQADFAFMQYQTILRDHPSSRYAEPAWFAKGEYSFTLGNFAQAKEAFRTFLNQYPESKGKLFALAHLLRIARVQNDETAAQAIETEMIKYKQVSLVFRDKKEFKYKSPLKKHSFKAAVHINKIEIYAGGELFAKISY